jgi:DNA (cytosine-5)-methyltransferase 1
VRSAPVQPSELRIVSYDLNDFDTLDFVLADLISTGLPYPPFSVAGSSLVEKDERGLFPAVINRQLCSPQSGDDGEYPGNNSTRFSGRFAIWQESRAYGD